MADPQFQEPAQCTRKNICATKAYYYYWTVPCVELTTMPAPFKVFEN